MEEYRDCLACGYSMSEEDSENEGDKLFCSLHQKYVLENEICSDFN